MEEQNTTQQEFSEQFNFFSRMNIQAKLITIISLILISAMTVMIFLATYFFRSDNQVRIQENNLKLAEVISLKVNSDFTTIAEKLNLMGTTMIQQFRSGAQKALFTGLFFTNDKDYVYVGIANRSADGTGLVFRQAVQNNDFFTVNQITPAQMNEINRVNSTVFLKSFSNQPVVQNVSNSFNVPVMGVSIPFQKGPGGSVQSIVFCYIKLDKFLQAFKTAGIFKAYMVNSQGDILAHPDTNIVLSHGNYLNLPIVQMMLKSKTDNGQTRYRDKDGVWHLGAFKKTGFSGIGIIATVEEQKAFEAVYRIQRRNIYITVIVLALAFIIVYFFGKTLASPIIRLVGATKEIEDGNFHVSIRPTTGDEIGRLTSSFIQMGRGLEEREKMKDAFGKFVNKEIAEQVLKGEIKLGGERKKAAVFFSDIRSFTAISEKLEPEEVVEFLNEYMTRMVQCVNDTGGVVDKYIGDAIMAIWGAPVSRGNDTENAINGALMMRKELIDFNRGRGGEKKPIIKIGSGINTGPVLAGQIGSEDRMEYTVIGDTVNLASRVEALNKPFGTDILISEDAYAEVRDVFRVEAMQKIKVKGKAEPQQIYAVLGRLDDPASPKSLEKLRDLLGIDMQGIPETPADEEVKYEIIEENKQ